MSSPASQSRLPDAMPAHMTAREWRASASLASIFALRMLGLFLVLPVFAVHAQTLPGGDNATLVGLALGIYGLTQACLQIPFGIASDRFGRKRVIALGLVLFAAGSFIAAAASDIGTTILGRTIQGAGAISAAVTAMIADSTRDEHRTKAMAMVGGSIGLTFALSLVLAPPLYAAIGMGGLFALTGVLAIGAIAVVAWVVPDVPAAPSGIGNDATALPWSRVVFDPELLRLNLGIFTLHTVQMAMFVVVPLLLVARGLPLAEHWLVYLPVVLASFVLMLPPIVVGERRARMRPVFLASVALLIAVQLGLAWQAWSLAWLVVWLLLFFVGFNVLEASLPSLVSRRAPPARKGLALGVYNTTQAAGLFAGGVLGGWLARHYSDEAVFLFSAAALALWLALAWGMRELPPRRKARADSAV